MFKGTNVTLETHVRICLWLRSIKGMTKWLLNRDTQEVQFNIGKVWTSFYGFRDGDIYDKKKKSYLFFGDNLASFSS